MGEGPSVAEAREVAGDEVERLQRVRQRSGALIGSQPDAQRALPGEQRIPLPQEALQRDDHAALRGQRRVVRHAREAILDLDGTVVPSLKKCHRPAP